MDVVLFGLACFFILAMALPFFRSGAWWIRMFDFPRVQIAVLSLAVLLGHAWVWEQLAAYQHTAAGVLALGILYQVYRILPYTPLAPRQVLPAREGCSVDRFRLMIANVLMTNRDVAAFLALVREHAPDIVLTVETDSRWEEALRGLETAYPYSVKHPLDNTYGMLLYSKLPLRHPRIRFLITDDVPSIFAGVTLPSGATFDLICLHPRPPRPDIQQDATERDAELLIVAREIEGRTHPTVVAGDMNDVAWSHTTRLIQRLSGLLDPRRGRGLYSTFHVGYPFWRYPLDHVFHSKHFRLVTLRRLGRFGSDHFPMYAELSYEPIGAPDQDTPEADDGDEREAVQKIVQAL